MDFKIENRVLDITNYPSVERHLENMANDGWLLTKIVFQNIFIYKRAKPEKLEFSISPYEVETMLTRKSKKELEEFQSVCESVGWDYATTSGDFHIYFKQKDAEAIEIETDDEEEFRTLEEIGQKWIRHSYFQIAIFLLLSWFMTGNTLNNIHAMKDGVLQILIFILPFMIILAITRVLGISKFIKKNKKNIEIGKPMEYSESKQNLIRILSISIIIIFIIFILYSIYIGLVLKNYVFAISMIPLIIGVSLGKIYRKFVKPSRKVKGHRKLAFGLVVLLAGIISAVVGGTNILGLTDNIELKNKIDLGNYKVITFDDFDDNNIENAIDLRRNMSLLVPESYEYLSYNKSKDMFLITEYADVLNEDLAKNLVKRYIRQAELRLEGRYFSLLDYAFEEKEYGKYLSESGLTKYDFNILKEKDISYAINKSKEIIKKKSIKEDNKGLWKVDEVYFLSYLRDEIVLRKGKEVFYLEGKDFSDSLVRDIVKERLGLKDK